jgi:hypothetical protein
MSKPLSSKANEPLPQQQQDVAVFMKYVFFFVLFFLILLLIASFGTVAEAKGFNQVIDSLLVSAISLGVLSC